MPGVLSTQGSDDDVWARNGMPASDQANCDAQLMCQASCLETMTCTDYNAAGAAACAGSGGQPVATNTARGHGRPCRL